MDTDIFQPFYKFFFFCYKLHWKLEATLETGHLLNVFLPCAPFHYWKTHQPLPRVRIPGHGQLIKLELIQTPGKVSGSRPPAKLTSCSFSCSLSKGKVSTRQHQSLSRSVSLFFSHSISAKLFHIFIIKSGQE